MWSGFPPSPARTIAAPYSEQGSCSKLQVGCGRWTRIPLEDTEGEAIQDHFQAAADFIQEAADAGGAALVHCHEGRSRSVTLVLAYLLHTQVLPSLEGCLRRLSTWWGAPKASHAVCPLC